MNKQGITNSIISTDHGKVPNTVGATTIIQVYAPQIQDSDSDTMVADFYEELQLASNNKPASGMLILMGLGIINLASASKNRIFFPLQLVYSSCSV